MIYARGSAITSVKRWHLIVIRSDVEPSNYCHSEQDIRLSLPILKTRDAAGQEVLGSGFPSHDQSDP